LDERSASVIPLIRALSEEPLVGGNPAMLVKSKRGEFSVCKTLTRWAAFIAVIPVAALVLAGCGESAEEKATAQVCSSTKEIRAQLSKLSELSISSKAPEEIKDAAAVIQKEAGKVKESAPNLPSARKSEVESAQKALQSELIAAATALASSVKSSGDAQAVLKQSEPQVKAAVAGLAGSYRQAFEALKCS
jgi:hypothetical protein